MSGFKITELYAFITVDNEDGDEGIIGFQMPDGTMMPMIGADTRRVDELKEVAEGLGLEYEIKYFDLRTE